ncbi:hypothetical protein FIC87_11355 [Eggerthella lenta]|uniref:Uncharacterized protein n=1 Tax=Eggerthella lenta TaxID=84112 RepID=A0A5C5BSF7_EGGLN|nr:hypothetical protein [Eggerthella lenta]TNU89388.1 hypothetical protein FIC87_11355 [Eggerthella lenta]
MNDVVVGGVSLEQRYGLVLTSESEFNPPKPKEYLLDLPGGDGSLDVTEAFGDVLYENREDVLVLAAEGDPEGFERVKTEVARFLHGKVHDYALSFDPGYIRRGRFAVDEWYSRMHCMRMRVRISANPYKSAGVKVHEVDAQAGAHLTLKPGRRRVRPVFECSVPIHVISNGVDVHLPAGSHTAVGLTISAGNADVYVNASETSVFGGTTTWADLKGMTWADLKGKKWNEVMWLGGPPPENDAYKVKIAYEVLEL